MKNSSNTISTKGTSNSTNASLLGMIKNFYIKNKNTLNNIFYVLLCIQFIDTFIDTTTLPPGYIYMGAFYEIFFAIIAFLFSLSCLFSITFTILFEQDIDKSSKIFSVALILIGGLYSITTEDSSNSEIFDFLICIAACIGKSHKKILKSLLISGSIIMIIALLASQAGLISDYVYTPGRHSLGIIYCTDFGAHVVFLVLAYIILKNYSPNIKTVIISLITFEVCYFIAMAKTASICILITLTGITIEYLFQKYKKHSFFAFFKGIMLIIFPLAYVFFCVLTAFYSYYPAVFPNGTFTSRLAITSLAFNKYNLELFSQYIKQNGNGGSAGANADASSNASNLLDVEKSGLPRFIYALAIIILIVVAFLLFTKKIYMYGATLSIIALMMTAAPGIAVKLGKREIIGGNTLTEYFWLDCSFMRILFCNGVMVFITILLLSVFIQYRALKAKNYLFMFIMCVIALDCTIEHHLTDISYNFIFMLALTDYFDTNKQKTCIASSDV